MNEKLAEQHCISCGKLYHPLAGDTGLCPECASFIVQSSPVVAVRSRTLPSKPVNSEIWQEGQTLLDTYEVKGKLGEGGMGIVYRVHHNTWNLDLALKQPKVEVVAQAGVETFVNEAQAWVDLGLHSHITTCYYVRNIEELPCVFAELVEGGSLADWIEKGKLRRLEDMLDVAIQFAWGLHYAHELNMIHQDVKPENVLIKEDGTAKVTDFGLVKVQTKGLMSISGKGTILAEWGGGTQAYFSPEQSAAVDLSNQAWQWAEAGEKELSDKLRDQIGQLPKPTRRTDLWSWAVSVLEMFNGERTGPYGSAAGETLKAYLQNGPAVAGLPAMPPEVGALLGECFQEDPERRPHDLQVAAERLVEVYREVVGKPYFRQQPKAVDLRADSLNNKALSLLDLGLEEKAIKAWQEALKADPLHSQAVFNLGMFKWRSGRESDDLELLRSMENIQSSQAGDWQAAYLLSLIHLERGDMELARTAVRRVKSSARNAILIQDLEARLKSAESAECVQKFDGHTSRVVKVAFSPDGKSVVSGSEDKTIRVWDISSGRCRLTLTGHRGWITDFVFTHDGRRLLSTSYDKKLKLWDLNTGTCLQTFKGHRHDLKRIVLSKEGRYAMSAEGGPFPSSHPMRLWDIESGKCLRTFEGHQGWVNALRLSDSGRVVVSCGGDKTARIWEFSSGRCIHVLKGHDEEVTDIDISADERIAITCGNDANVVVWDLHSGQQLAYLRGHTDNVYRVKLFANATRAISCGRDHTLRIWDLNTYTCEKILYGHKGGIYSFVLTPDEKRVLSGSWDFSLRFWDIASGRCLRTFEGHQAAIYGIDVDPQAKYALTGGGGIAEKDFILRLWSLEGVGAQPAQWAISQPIQVAKASEETGIFQEKLSKARDALAQGRPATAGMLLAKARTIKGYERDPELLELWHQAGLQTGLRKGLHGVHCKHVVRAHDDEKDDSVTSIAILPDDKTFLSCSAWHSVIRQWDLRTGQRIREISASSQGPNEIAFTPHPAYFVTGGLDRKVRLWNLESGTCVHEFPEVSDEIFTVAVNPDGNFAASGGRDKAIHIWDLRGGQIYRELSGIRGAVSHIIFTPDGRYLYSCGWDGLIYKWDPANGECLATASGHQETVKEIRITRDGRMLLSASWDNTLKLWDTRSMECVRTLKGHTESILGVALSPDDQFAISSAGDQTLRIWRLKDGKCVHVVEGHTDIVTCVNFTTDGRYAVSGSTDRTVRVWELDWEYNFQRSESEFDRILPYLRTFLTLHTPYSIDGFTHSGRPSWTEEDLRLLMQELQYRGYGWVRANKVRQVLNRLSSSSTL